MAATKNPRKAGTLRTVDLGHGRTVRIRVVNGPNGRTVYGQLNRKKG